MINITPIANDMMKETLKVKNNILVIELENLSPLIYNPPIKNANKQHTKANKIIIKFIYIV